MSQRGAERDLAEGSPAQSAEAEQGAPKSPCDAQIAEDDLACNAQTDEGVLGTPCAVEQLGVALGSPETHAKMVPGWILKLQAAGLSGPELEAANKVSEEPPRYSVVIEEQDGTYRARCTQAGVGSAPSMGPWRKSRKEAQEDGQVVVAARGGETLPKVKKLESQKEDRKMKQALLLDMFKRSLAKSLEANPRVPSMFKRGLSKSLETDAAPPGATSEVGPQAAPVSEGGLDPAKDLCGSPERIRAMLASKGIPQVRPDADAAANVTPDAVSEGAPAPAATAEDLGLRLIDETMEALPTPEPMQAEPEAVPTKHSMEIEEQDGSYRACCTFAAGSGALPVPSVGPWRKDLETAREDGETLEATHREAASPPMDMPQVWAEALEGAFPALRRLRRVSAGMPAEDAEAEEEDSEEEEEEDCCEDEEPDEDVQENEQEVIISEEFHKRCRMASQKTPSGP